MAHGVNSLCSFKSKFQYSKTNPKNLLNKSDFINTYNYFKSIFTGEAYENRILNDKVELHTFIKTKSNMSFRIYIIQLITNIYNNSKKNYEKNNTQFKYFNEYLKDLNYYSIDTDKELKKYLINNLCKIISDKLEYDFYSNINEKNIAEILEEIKSSNDYKKFVTQINKNVERGFVLSKFISDCNNILNFYNALTLEELNKLNY